MIQFRWRQRWIKATCECDHKNNWGTLSQKRGESRAKILYVECSTCGHLYCIDMIEEFETPKKPWPIFSGYYIFPATNNITRFKNKSGNNVCLKSGTGSARRI